MSLPRVMSLALPPPSLHSLYTQIAHGAAAGRSQDVAPVFTLW